MTFFRSYYTKGEHVLSSYEALASIGFEDALGKDNVFIGTLLHKRLINEQLTLSHTPQFEEFDTEQPPFQQQLLHEKYLSTFSCFGECISRSLKTELDALCPDSVTMLNVLPCFRMLFVRALVNSLFGPHILAAAPNFPEEYIRFQDDYEETIAKVWCCEVVPLM